MRISRLTWMVGAWVAVAALSGPPRAAAQGDLSREFEFASKLVEIGFADYAERLVDEIVRLHPDQKDRSKMLQAEILTARKKFDDAEKLLKEMPAGSPTTQAAKLAVANGLYRYREIDRAKKIYQEFFDQYKDKVPTDADLKRFYMESAFRFGQMLEKSGDMAGAVKAYENVLKCNPEPGIARKMRQDLAYLLVKAGKAASGDARKAFIDRAWKLCEEIQWGKEGIDLTFGHSIVVMAEIQVLRGQPDEAAKTIRHNLDLMKGLDDIIKEQKLPLSDSPLAPTRFLLGDIMQKKGEAAGNADEAVKYLLEAVTQFVNVFAKYGDSDWGPDAGARVETIRGILKNKYKKEIKVDLGQYAQKAIDAQFKMADEMFVQKRYAEAARETLRVLNAFPKMPSAGPMFSNLLISFANLKATLDFDVAAGYIAECRRADPTSGLALLAAAKYCFDQKDTTTAMRLYDQFVNAFPKHEKTPQVLYMLASMLKKDNREADGLKYLQQIVDQWPQDQYYLKAISQMAWTKYQAKDYQGALELFQKYIKDSSPDHNRANAQFTLADCFVRLEDYASAVREYRTLVTWLEPQDNNPYGKTTEEVKRNADMLQKARFYVGYGLVKVAAPDDATKKALRQKAIEELESFIKAFSKTDLAPKAMNLIGAVYLELGQSDKASETFQRLQKEYPASEDGKSALFSMIRAAVEIKRMDLANQGFEQMMKEDPPGQPAKKYSADQFVRIGQWMLEGGQFKNAIAAFEKVMGSGSDDRAVLERTLYGLGQSYYAVTNLEKSVQTLDDLLTRYPKSGLFFDAKMLMCKALNESGKPADAIAPLSDVMKFAPDALLQTRASMELGRIQMSMAKKFRAENKEKEATDSQRSALASYERVALLGDEKNKDIAPMIEEALLRSIELYTEIQRFDDAVGACDRYEKLFPNGASLSDVRKKRNEIKLKATLAPAPAPAAGPAKAGQK